MGQKKNLEIGIDTKLIELRGLIHKGRRIGKIEKSISSALVLGMLGHLDDENEKMWYIPRQIHTVGELYSFTEDEILYEFSRYKKKTWRKLNEILVNIGLSPLKLPREYTTDL